MSRWLEEEKIHQAEFKRSSAYFSEAARCDGLYKNRPWPFCLPRQHAEENLFSGIRPAAVAYFNQHLIKWHDGQSLRPSNHLCSSQVCCINFLFPFADKPAALAGLLKSVYPELAHMLPIEDKQYVAHEWIGQQNYLGEKVGRSGRRTLHQRRRGRNVSAYEWSTPHRSYRVEIH